MGNNVNKLIVDIFKILKWGGELSTQDSYPAKITFETEGERKTCLDIDKLKEFINSRPALQEMLKEIHQAEEYDTDHRCKGK